MKLLFSFFILCLPPRTFAIVGSIALSDGERVKIRSHTVAVLNAQNSASHSRCTGTLLSPNVVLTAAHCIPTSLENFFIVPSIYEFAVLARHQVVRVLINEDYKLFDIPKVNQPNSDLALVQFEGPLPEGYAPTSYINTFQPQVDQFWLYVAGYGVSDEAKSDTGELRFSKAIIENALMNSAQSFMQGNQAGGFGICKGDSGGPAYIKIKDEFYVLGIVSAIVGGCNGTSYFNQTLFYQDWVQKSLSLLSVSNRE